MKRPNQAGRRATTLSGLAAFGRAAALCVVVTSACSSESDDDKRKSGSDFPTEIQPAAQGGDAFMSPFDATPDPEGKVVYFTALTRDGEPGVFKVVPGGQVERLHVGAPLSTPFGIAITDDGKTLVIADADAERDEADGGSLFTLAIAGGAPSVLSGTQGLYPRGLDIHEGDVYFTGRSAERKAGLFKIPVAGGVAAPVAVGTPFDDPSGVAVRKNGEVYVADSSPAEGVGAAVIKLAAGKAEIFKTDIAVGHPAGVALTQDETAIFVSGLDGESGTDVVFRFDLASGERKSFDTVIKDFNESAGLHRAKRAGVFAWADSRAGGGGTVYVLKN